MSKCAHSILRQNITLALASSRCFWLWPCVVPGRSGRRSSPIWAQACWSWQVAFAFSKLKQVILLGFGVRQGGLDGLHRLLFKVRRNYIFSILGNVFAAQLSGGRPTPTPWYVLAPSRSRKSPVSLRLNNPVLCNSRQGRRRARCASPNKRILLTIRIVRIMIYRIL